MNRWYPPHYSTGLIPKSGRSSWLTVNTTDRLKVLLDTETLESVDDGGMEWPEIRRVSFNKWTRLGGSVPQRARMWEQVRLRSSLLPRR